MRIHVVLAVIGFAGCASAEATRDQGARPDASTFDGGRDAAREGDSAVGVPNDASQAGGGSGSAGGSPCSNTGVLASWTFASEPGSQTSTAMASSVPGIVAGDVQRAPSLHTASGTGSMNSSNWATSAQADASRYYTLTVTSPAGCALDITAAVIDARASASGPAMATLATSADGFSHSVAISTNAASSPTLAATNQTGSVEIRIYGFATTSAVGTMRLQNTLTLSGATH